MNKHLFTILLLLLCLPGIALGEVVVLQSGKSITGEIVMQNDDVLILRDSEGRKFQLPQSEVKELKAEQQIIENIQSTTTTSSEGNCALRLDMCGGGVFVPSMQNGGSASFDFQIGTRHIGQQSIFLGGSVGYQAAICDKVYNFLPLMMVVSVPLIEGKHAPEVGAALGYAFALKQPNQGGLCAKMDLSWRYAYQQNSALLLGIQARFQNAQVGYAETIENKTYTSVMGKNFVSLGLRLALQF